MVGFDACLMATLETGLMLNDYADYMLASEETEPGIGWYYTKWVTALSKNTSISTLDLGKQVIDDFVDECNRRCAGQKTTLSLVDLAELSATAPKSLKDFASSTSKLLSGSDYKQVSDALSSMAPGVLSSLSAATQTAQSQPQNSVDLSGLLQLFGGQQQPVQQQPGIGSLFGSLLGGGQAQQQTQSSGLGSLLGSLFGMQPQQQQASGFDGSGLLSLLLNSRNKK